MNTSVPARLPGGKNTTAEKLLVAASELMIEEYAAMHGFRYTVLRCGVIAGR